jgi:hypothetical protein
MGGGQTQNFGLGNIDKFAWVGGFLQHPTRKNRKNFPNPKKS